MENVSAIVGVKGPDGIIFRELDDISLFFVNVKRAMKTFYEIGRITKNYNGMYEITLSKPLSQNDIIRIDHNNEDVNLSVAKLYDRDGNLINGSTDVCYIRIKEKLSKVI